MEAPTSTHRRDWKFQLAREPCMKLTWNLKYKNNNIQCTCSKNSGTFFVLTGILGVLYLQRSCRLSPWSFEGISTSQLSCSKPWGELYCPCIPVPIKSTGHTIQLLVCACANECLIKGAAGEAPCIQVPCTFTCYLAKFITTFTEHCATSSGKLDCILSWE